MDLSFTSQDAVELFKKHAGFEFNVTVPGQLLARRRVQKIDPSQKPARYCGSNWMVLWEDMLDLAMRRCSFDASLTPPHRGIVPPLEFVMRHRIKTSEQTVGGVAKTHNAKEIRFSGAKSRPSQSAFRLNREASDRLQHLLGKDD